MTGRLHDKVCLVTGATGIGAATARACAAEGAAVFVVSIDPDDCAAVCDEIAATGRECGWAAADLRDEQETMAAFAACRDRFGPPDGLVAVVGGSGRGFGDGPLAEVTVRGWEETISLNLRTAFLTGREALRSMVDSEWGGAIVFVTSALAAHPAARYFSTHAYAAAKGGIIALTKAAAARYAADGIRVNAIAPGLVDTPMAGRAATDPDIVDYAARRQPLAGGLLSADDVADAAVFLLSDDARQVTGQILGVDGGWSVGEG